MYDYSYGIDSNTSVTSANRSISQIGADNSDDVYSHVVLVSKGNEAPEVYVDGEKKGTSFRPPFKNYDFRTCKFVTTDGLHPTIKFKNGDFATIMQKEDYKRRLKLDSKLGLMVDNYRLSPASTACPTVATSNFTLGTSFTFEFSMRIQEHDAEAYLFYMTGGTPSDYSYYGSHWGGVVGRKTITVQRSTDDRLWVRLQTWNSSGKSGGCGMVCFGYISRNLAK